MITMRKISYTKLTLIILISVIICGCTSKIQTNSNDFQPIQKLSDNKFFKKYLTISRSGNIAEKMDITVKGDNRNISLDFRLFANIEKNINSGSQNGIYQFEMTNTNTSFDEVENISGFVDLVSFNQEYYVYPRDIMFLGPKGKYSNKDTETKITQVENHRINIDKEIPFKKTSETILAIQKALIDIDEIYFRQNTGFIDISYNYGDLNIDGKIYGNTGVFYGFSGQTVQFTKKRNKIHLFLSGQKSDTNLYLSLGKSRNSIKIHFDGDIKYKNLSEFTPEIKLDIKGKYIITNSGYIQVDLPKDYLNFTQTPLTKK